MTAARAGTGLGRTAEGSQASTRHFMGSYSPLPYASWQKEAACGSRNLAHGRCCAVLSSELPQGLHHVSG